MNETINPYFSVTLAKTKWFLLAGIYFFFFHTLVAYIISTFSSINPLRVEHNSFYIEPLMLFILFFVLTVLTRRFVGSIILTSVFYILFMLINIEKIAAFGVPLYPIDFFHSIELIRTWEVISTYIPTIVLTTVFLVLLLVLIFKLEKKRVYGKHINSVRALLTGVLILVFLNHSFIAKSLKIAKITKSQSYPLKGSEKNGFLFTFIFRVLTNDKPEPPNNYGYDLVFNVFEKHKNKAPAVVNNTPPNVIIFFIEAFTDPRQMGLKTSFDPIPNFRFLSNKHSSGQVISPVVGGRSANAEFELLTGFTMRFVANGSIPYIDLLNDPKPSIVKEFKRNGYETNAVHVASLGYFNYQIAYPNLGFNYINTILHDSKSNRDPAGRYPDENSLVNKITALTSRKQPQFIFAFPNSTHGLWNYPAYLDSDLNVEGNFFEQGEQEIKTYVNAVYNADKAIGNLVNHYESFDEDTVILIMGDHQPSLPEYRQQYMIQNHLKKQNVESLFESRKAMINSFKKLIVKTDSTTLLMNHRVPYVIWTNFDSPNIKQNLSMNLLSAKLLTFIKFNPSPLYTILIKMYEEIEEFSMLVKVGEGEYSEEIPDRFKALVFDYQVLQYDVLYGKNYYRGLLDKHNQH